GFKECLCQSRKEWTSLGRALRNYYKEFGVQQWSDIFCEVSNGNLENPGDLVFPKTRNALYCIRFVPRSTQTDYISIENKDGCFSSYGRTGGKEVVSLRRNDCVYHGLVQHELLHALGFYHEHHRSDHDQYVRINWDNIILDKADNFQKQNSKQNTPYDYGSVMHYGKNTFFTKPGLKTFIPIPNEMVEIGQSQGMSNIDILRVNKLYGC
ncbi:low choriolytic enzyme-like, partial [Carassius auratus]|uniref:Metalloendopeptidase n=1 Tax=Carassius auratus TaxID=7957 RepID=A0A6P6M480_CARAU